MSEPITNLPDAVRELGALPVPAGPEPQALTVEQLQLRVDEVERKYTFDTAELKRRIAELEAQRHVTNEALDDAVQALRVKQTAFETVRALCDAADYAGITSGGWFTVEAIRKALGLVVPDGLTRNMPVASLREPEPEFHAYLHHENRVGHDLPKTGGPTSRCRCGHEEDLHDGACFAVGCGCARFETGALR